MGFELAEQEIQINMAFSWNTVLDTLGLGSDGSDELKAGYDRSKATLAQAQKNLKSSSQIQQEGRASAGQAAADKAGQAKKAATAAAKMSGVGRLAAATKGAAAAADASTQGYSEAASQGAQMAQAAQQNQLALASKQAELEKQEGEAQAQLQQEKKRRKQEVGKTIASALTSVFSDGRFKNYRKHEYVRDR